MQYLLLVYTDAELLDKLPEAEFNVKMRDCIRHSDDQKTQGNLNDEEASVLENVLAYLRMQFVAASRKR